MRDGDGQGLEHVQADAAMTAGSGGLPVWRLLAALGMVVVVVLLGIIAYELHRQSDEARAAGCYERMRLLQTFNDASTDPHIEATLTCIGVRLARDNGSCVTITFESGVSIERIDAFAAGVLAGTGTSGVAHHGGSLSSPTVEVGIRAAEVPEVLEQAGRTDIVAAATARPRPRHGLCGQP